jgi:hypothetical protein
MVGRRFFIDTLGAGSTPHVVASCVTAASLIALTVLLHPSGLQFEGVALGRKTTSSTTAEPLLQSVFACVTFHFDVKNLSNLKLVSTAVRAWCKAACTPAVIDCSLYAWMHVWPSIWCSKQWYSEHVPALQTLSKLTTYPTLVHVCVASDKPKKLKPALARWAFPGVELCDLRNTSESNAATGGSKFAATWYHRAVMQAAVSQGNASMAQLGQ